MDYKLKQIRMIDIRTENIFFIDDKQDSNFTLHELVNFSIWVFLKNIKIAIINMAI